MIVAENNTLMSFSVSDGADFSSAFVNFSQWRVFGARSMETHHREVGNFLLYCSPRQHSWRNAFPQTKETSCGQLIHDIISLALRLAIFFRFNGAWVQLRLSTSFWRRAILCFFCQEYSLNYFPPKRKGGCLWCSLKAAVPLPRWWSLYIYQSALPQLDCSSYLLAVHLIQRKEQIHAKH
jgi:hypothetical protein